MKHLSTSKKVWDYLQERDPVHGLQNYTDFGIALIQFFAKPEDYHEHFADRPDLCEYLANHHKHKLFKVLSELFGEDVRINIHAIKQEFDDLRKKQLGEANEW